jgi:hypothetical protein
VVGVLIRSFGALFTTSGNSAAQVTHQITKPLEQPLAKPLELLRIALCRAPAPVASPDRSRAASSEVVYELFAGERRGVVT